MNIQRSAIAGLLFPLCVWVPTFAAPPAPDIVVILADQLRAAAIGHNGD